MVEIYFVYYVLDSSKPHAGKILECITAYCNSFSRI